GHMPDWIHAVATVGPSRGGACAGPGGPDRALLHAGHALRLREPRPARAGHRARLGHRRLRDARHRLPAPRPARALRPLGAHRRHPDPSAGPPGGAARLIRGGAAMLRALLIAFTLAWEAYTILVVSDA